MKIKLLFLLFLISISAIASSPEPEPKWGFFGHRRINRLAVFALPPELIPFYKQNIEYITEHAVDPDKRRYATRHEAPRHFIDLDRYGKAPFETLPRGWNEALAQFTEVFLVDMAGDTVKVVGEGVTHLENNRLMGLGRTRDLNAQGITVKDYQQFFNKNILPQYYEEIWQVAPDSLAKVVGTPLPCRSIFAKDHLSEHGILPYNLLQVQRRLTEAFYTRNVAAILRLSAEIGHYIGDAHVPLHTTKNYNGQLSDQIGIHGFWESRIPELFADKSYDNFVGVAEYIKDPQSYYWNIVMESNSLVDSVLLIEKRLKQTLPADAQFCFEERLGVTIRTQCAEFAQAYQEAMSGMVENRWRSSIRAVSSAWYTAWVDAGKPELKKLNFSPDEKELQEIKALEASLKKGRIQGREHE
ncbi:zinc dependent phospholipase C family protein [Haliscomenobacter sp.]|uniref:zinc dependent phospholipase C family protein n=1 Tax=Haliscomenobacter sp. TaxID=2717303 RepID=UPI003364D4ED